MLSKLIKSNLEYIFNSRIIERMLLEVCSTCQYDCKYCCHEEAINLYKNFHLTLEELDKFLYYTKKSKYFIKEICIHGLGEPTLWKHLNEGIKILHESEVIGGIVMLSNGASIKNIEEETFGYTSKIRISNYPDSNKNDLLLSLKERFPEKIIIEDIQEFQKPPDRPYLGTIPCKCICPLPTFIKDKIFYCNGSAFGAAKLKGVNVFDCHEVYCELKENYLEDFMFNKERNYDLCQYCRSNSNIAKHLKSCKHGINNVE